MALWPRPAGADTGFPEGAGLSAFFNLRASGGYGSSVYGKGREVLLEVDGHHQLALYAVRGRVSARGMWARFGNLGRISVRFKPMAKVQRVLPPKQCNGKPRFTQFGVFVGVIRFAGEERYVNVDADRIRGRIERWASWKCHRAEVQQQYSALRAETMTQLEAQSQDGRLSFNVGWEPGYDERPESTALVAASGEEINHMKISRIARVVSNRDVFTFDEALTVASIGSAGPFDGTANFQRMAEGATVWEGSLSVNLPGAKNVSLTGPQFDVRLFHECEYLFCRQSKTAPAGRLSPA